jgi:putative ABC transport system permease protein
VTPRWRKLGGDIALNQGRLFMMWVAITVGVFAVAAISTAYAVLGREIDKNYLSANPPAALLDVDRLDDAAVAGVRRQDGIAWADAGGRLWGRIEVQPQQWLPLLLFIVPDFTAQQISTVKLQQGQWPTRMGELVIERTAMSLARASVGHEINVQTPNGPARGILVTGVVHDPSLAPAPQQQVVYGYVTQATLHLLGENIAFHSLQVSVNPSEGRPTVEQAVVRAAQWLKHAGYDVGEISIPPRHHPHWGVMSNIVRMLLAFSVLTLILSALLSATLTANLLSPQVRQIGIMKAIGARTSQIMALYLTLIGSIGLIAIAIGMPSGIYAGRTLANFVARNQNIELSSLSVPAWIYLAVAVGGTGIPLLFAVIPIGIATNRTVRECLMDFGVAVPASTPGRWASSLFQRFPIPALAMRNSVRRRARLALSLGLMGMAGALFITSLNILSGWKQGLVDAQAERHYDIEIQLRKPQPVATLRTMVSSVSGVRNVEVFDDEPAALRRGDGFIITKTFPDGEHGSLSLNAVPANSTFVSPNVIAGRWLTTADLPGAVINNQALSFFPGANIGDLLDLTVRGRPVRLRLAGIVREHLARATIYLTSEEYSQEFGHVGLTGGLRLGLDDKSEVSEIKVMAAIERSLEDGGVKVAGSTSRNQLGLALAGHLSILIFILVVISILMGLVGLFGLGSAMATSVLERRRELAVLRAIGASNAAIVLAVIFEGVFIGFLSVIAAAVLSVPVTMLIATLVGSEMLGPWQGVIVSATGIPIWIAVVLLCATLASGYPARRASTVTIREALTYQ